MSRRYGPPVFYRGVRMRSRFEGRFASVLDLFKIAWQYEPGDFILTNQRVYRPDFWLPEGKTWVELKGFVEEASDEELDRFDEFAWQRIASGDDALFVPGNGASLLMRDDNDWQKFAEFEPSGADATCDQMLSWSLRHWVTGAFRHCPSCQRWFIGRTGGEEPCRLCGHWRRVAELTYDFDIECVDGRVCPDDADIVEGDTGIFASMRGDVWGRRFNLTSFKALHEIGTMTERLGPMGRISDPKLCAALEYFDRKEPEPRPPKSGAPKEEFTAYVAAHQEWQHRWDDMFADVTGMTPAYELWERCKRDGDASGSGDESP